MSNPTCETCRWWEEFAPDGDPLGSCHRNAPAPAMGQDAESDPEAFWPVTQGHDFCGEHASKPQEVSKDDIERISRKIRSPETTAERAAFDREMRGAESEDATP